MIDQRPTDTTKTSHSSPRSAAGVSSGFVRGLKNSLGRIKTDTSSRTKPTGSSPLAEGKTPMQTPKAVKSSHPKPQVKAPVAKPNTSTTRKPRKPAAATTRRQSRRARLRISRVDPWSVMKTSLLFGVAGWIIFIIATYILFTVIGMTGLYEAINSSVSSIFASPDSVSTFNIQDYINTTRATALAALVGAVNVVIITALATIFSFLYNLSAVVMGGLEITMAED